MRAVLISTYDLGRQPFGLASPAAWLRELGVEVSLLDVSRSPLDAEAIAAADLVGLHLPMHTATRLAVPVIRRVRAWNPRAHVCAYGLYAPMNATYLRHLGVQTILGGEFEQDLVALARHLRDGAGVLAPAGSRVPRLAFRVPDREGLPALERYARLQMPNAPPRIVGYTEGSRGCKHRCRHCPIVPVYQGAFRLVPPEVVLADIRRQVARGAQHISFGDPDFFNSVRHALAIVEGLSREHPGLTYDVTIKIEHLLEHVDALRRLRETGCLFVTSAVESFDDLVLAHLCKGHSRLDVERAAAICRDIGIGLAPTFVPFTPWTTLERYCDLLTEIARLGLVEQVAPIQLAIRLLIPEGSRLLELEAIRPIVEPFDPVSLAYPWRHADPRVDALQREVADRVGARPGESRTEVFEAVAAIAFARAELGRPSTKPVREAATVPFLTEPWYC